MVVFYSINDMSSGANLQEVEVLLKGIDTNQIFTINQLLEFYNIQTYFEHEMFLIVWDNITIEEFKKKIEILIPKV